MFVFVLICNLVYLLFLILVYINIYELFMYSLQNNTSSVELKLREFIE